MKADLYICLYHMTLMALLIEMFCLWLDIIGMRASITFAHVMPCLHLSGHDG